MQFCDEYSCPIGGGVEQLSRWELKLPLMLNEKFPSDSYVSDDDDLPSAFFLSTEAVSVDALLYSEFGFELISLCGGSLTLLLSEQLRLSKIRPFSGSTMGCSSTGIC